MTKKSKGLRKLFPLPPPPIEPEDIVAGLSEGMLKILKAIQTADEYIKKADNIFKTMDYMLSGEAQISRGLSTEEKNKMKNEVVKLLDDFINTRNKEALEKAYGLAKLLPEGCEVCIKYIAAAVDAMNEGLVDEAIEWAKIVRRVVRVM